MRTFHSFFIFVFKKRLYRSIEFQSEDTQQDSLRVFLNQIILGKGNQRNHSKNKTSFPAWTENVKSFDVVANFLLLVLQTKKLFFNTSFLWRGLSVLQTTRFPRMTQLFISPLVLRNLTRPQSLHVSSCCCKNDQKCCQWDLAVLKFFFSP